MPSRKIVLVWIMLSLVAVATVVTAIEKGLPNTSLNRATLGTFQEPISPPSKQASLNQLRNLSLQPEAFKLSKRLGHRFNDSRPTSVAIGTVSAGGKTELLTLTRRQNKRGENIEIAFAADPSTLTWDEAEGVKAINRQANDTQRELVERLVLDSADQFVLAQLRGASYYTVARNVRPAKAGDSDAYNGPLWTIVRIDEPNGHRSARKSRFYYLNEATGLIDKIVAEVRGEQLEAAFTGWTSVDGETLPSHIVWTRNGQPLMEFTLNNFVRRAAQ